MNFLPGGDLVGWLCEFSARGVGRDLADGKGVGVKDMEMDDSKNDDKTASEERDKDYKKEEDSREEE